MRIISVVLLFMALTIAAAAQSPQTQKAVDSVCDLIKKYMNEKSTEKLYQLTGPAFQKAINSEAFRNVTENNLWVPAL